MDNSNGELPEVILRTELTDLPYRVNMDVYDYILLGLGKLDDSRLHWLPMHQCPSPTCGDIGQMCWEGGKSGRFPVYHFYCPYCYTVYYIRFHSENKQAYHERMVKGEAWIEPSTFS